MRLPIELRIVRGKQILQLMLIADKEHRPANRFPIGSLTHVIAGLVIHDLNTVNDLSYPRS